MMKIPICFFILFSTFFSNISAQSGSNSYYGTFISGFQNTSNGVKGDVYVANMTTLFIKNFTFSGSPTGTLFYAGTQNTEPSASGTKITVSATSGLTSLPKTNQDLVLDLPPAMPAKDIKWLSLWNNDLKKSFGNVKFMSGAFKIPKPFLIGPFPGAHHNVSASAVTLTTDRTIRLTDLIYDGLGPDVYFFVGKGEITHKGATKVPNDKGGFRVESPYVGQTIELTLPNGTSWRDFEWFSMYCVQYEQNFGSVFIPDNFVDPLPPYNVLRMTRPSITNNANHSVKQTQINILIYSFVIFIIVNFFVL